MDPFVARLAAELPSAGLSIVAYGSAVRGGFVAGRSDLNVLVILPAATPNALQTVATAAEAGRKLGLVPVVVGLDELAPLARSAPLALWDIADRRLVLHGADPIAALEFELADLWRQLTFELRDKLLGLRQMQLSGQRPKPPEVFGRRLTGSLLHLFRAALRLYGRPALQNRVAAMGDAARHLKLDLTVLQRLHNGCYGDDAKAMRDVERLLADGQSLLEAALASLEALDPADLPAAVVEPEPEPVVAAVAEAPEPVAESATPDLDVDEARPEPDSVPTPGAETGETSEEPAEPAAAVEAEAEAEPAAPANEETDAESVVDSAEEPHAEVVAEAEPAAPPDDVAEAEPAEEPAALELISEPAGDGPALDEPEPEQP